MAASRKPAKSLLFLLLLSTPGSLLLFCLILRLPTPQECERHGPESSEAVGERKKKGPDRR